MCSGRNANVAHQTRCWLARLTEYSICEGAKHFTFFSQIKYIKTNERKYLRHALQVSPIGAIQVIHLYNNVQWNCIIYVQYLVKL